MSDAADYLVIGVGATGLAFTDSLVCESDAEVVLVDRREGVGGHWRDSYPFVRLHTASTFYGVNSLRLGEDRITQDGHNAGYYEQASGTEVTDYFEQVLNERLLATCRVRLATATHGRRYRERCRPTQAAQIGPYVAPASEQLSTGDVRM